MGKERKSWENNGKAIYRFIFMFIDTLSIKWKRFSALPNLFLCSLKVTIIKPVLFLKLSKK
ncbi:hypothetical protein D4R99_04335 [bacterium]|nr:MAG: hypothetical protein D4R99_04335 [bacterium]